VFLPSSQGVTPEASLNPLATQSLGLTSQTLKVQDVAGHVLRTLEDGVIKVWTIRQQRFDVAVQTGTEKVCMTVTLPIAPTQSLSWWLQVTPRTNNAAAPGGNASSAAATAPRGSNGAAEHAQPAAPAQQEQEQSQAPADAVQPGQVRGGKC